MGVDQSVIAADEYDTARDKNTASGISIKGASQNASPAIDASRIRSASNTSLPIADHTGDFNIRGAAAAQQSGDSASPRSVVNSEPRLHNPRKRPHDQIEDSIAEQDERPRRDRSPQQCRRLASAFRFSQDQPFVTRRSPRRSRSPKRLDKTFHREESPPRGPRLGPSTQHYGSDDYGTDRYDHRERDHWSPPVRQRPPLKDIRRHSWRNSEDEENRLRLPSLVQTYNPVTRTWHSSPHRAESGLPSQRERSPEGEPEFDLALPGTYPTPNHNGKRTISAGTDSNQEEHRPKRRVPAGLENAPTGPRSMKMRDPPAQRYEGLPKVSPGVLGSPHAFIPGYVLPPNQKTRDELLNFVRSYTPMGLHFDQSGYYITFKNDSPGHASLRACISEKQGSMFLGQYCLKLTPFFPVPRAAHRRFVANNAKSDRERERAQQEGQRQPEQPSSVPKASANATPTSMVRSRSHEAQDDSSSVSGATTASSVARSRSTCHVCNEPSSSVRPMDISCSTCPRRYHRMCTGNPPGPSNETTWQCNRCIKKQIQPRVILQSIEAENNVSEPADEAPRSILETIFVQPKQAHVRPVPESHPAEQPSSDDRTADLHSPVPQVAMSSRLDIDGAHDELNTGAVTDKPSPLHKDKHYDEADYLVQQSFAGRQSNINGDDEQKVRKPLFVRKKVEKPVQDSREHSITGFRTAERERLQPQPQKLGVTAKSRSKVTEPAEHGGPPVKEPQSNREPHLDGQYAQKDKTNTLGGPASVTSSKAAQIAPEDFSEPTGAAASDSRNDLDVPEIPETPLGTRTLSNNTPRDADTHVESSDGPARTKPAFLVARKSKFQDRSCATCGMTVPTKSSVPHFVCGKCQRNSQTQPPDAAAVEPNNGPRVNLQAVSQLDQDQGDRNIQDADMTGLEIIQQHPDQSLAQSKTGTPPDAASAVGTKETAVIPKFSSHEPPKSPSISREASTAPHGKQAGSGRGRKTTYSYVRMIGMALCDRGSLQMKGIVDWVHENIPGMQIMEKATMLSNVSGNVSLNVDDRGKQLFRYRKWQTGDSEEFGKGTWVELQPGKLDEHERWDPVLKEPVSPPRVAKERSAKAYPAPEPSQDVLEPLPAVQARADVGKLDGRTMRLSRVGPADDESSDEEPLAKIRRPAMTKVLSAPVAPMLGPDDVNKINTATAPKPAGKSTMSHSPVARPGSSPGVLQRPQRSSQLVSSRTSLSPDVMDIDSGSAQKDDAFEADGLAAGSTRDARPWSKPLGLQVTADQARGKSIGEILAMDAKLVEYSVASLFDEWPEYAPESQINKRAVMAVVKKRPTKKQMFGKPACYSRLAGSVGQGEVLTPPGPRTMRSKSPRQSMYWQFSEEGNENVKEFDSLEDFFGLPKNPLAILVDGKLAYRDGTRSEDGGLPRAKAIYRTGL